MTRRLSASNRVSSLAIAVALAAGPAPALAQFVGTIDSSTGIDTVNSTNSSLIITGQQAVINWTATDTPSSGVISFLPEGNSATFNGSSNYAVLNRVTPGTAGNAIFMGGNITSLIGGETVGGTVFFYSPNGIIIGQNAAINVGALGLTTLPITDSDGVWMSGFGTADPQVIFGQATDPNSFVRIVPMIDGSINARGVASLNGPSSYVALVAPRIEHSGVIRTDVAAALVAAEAATITFSPDGLFDIQVSTGTDDANGIDVDGGTIERRNLTEGTNSHYAYLVAVAKNDAVTMLVRNGGSIGFDTATSAAVEDNVVVLSGGRNISNGQTGAAVGNAAVNLEIDGASFSTDVEADISGGADFNTDSGNTSFGLDPTSTSLDLTAGANSIITATNGNALAIAGTLVVDLDKFGTSPLTVGNQLRLSANGTGSTLTIGGNAFLSAAAYGFDDFEGIDAGDATGGTVILQTGSGGTIDIDGSLSINVDGYGGFSQGFSTPAGNGTGGTAQIVANGGAGSPLTVDGPVGVSARGVGGSVFGDCLADCGVFGGNGTGGNILVQASTVAGSQLNLNSTVDLIATGEGNAGDLGAGSGLGGNIQLVGADAGDVTIAGNLTVDASGHGGFGMESSSGGGQGGNATGGFVAISFSGAASSIDLQGTSLFNADAFGGDGYAAGGNATGGWVNLQAGANGTLSAVFVGASADAFGGMSDIFNQGSGVTGGTATGGRAWMQAITGGSAIVTDLSLSASGFGGQSQSGAGGVATGGYVIASADNASLAVRATTDLEALGVGGHSSDDAGTGGLGTGGQADIFASNNGTVTLTGFTSLDTTGRGGSYFSSGATGGNGVGGTIFFQANDGGTLTASSEVQLTADGIGGFCNDCNQAGTGGDGTGGTVTIQAFGNPATSLAVAGEMNATAIGFGSSGFAGPGGDGQGGTVRLGVHDGATANFIGNLFLNASGNGGWQFNGGVAGNGTGGLIDAFINSSGGTLNVDGFAEFDASGFGGVTEGTDGTAGDGIGGFTRFMVLGGTANFDGDLVLYGEGHGGSAGTEGFSGTGGDGTGNIARIQAAGGDINIGGTASVSTTGYGGAGTTGGSGTGGGNFFTNTGGAHIVATNGDIVIGGAAVAMADGFGANGIDGGNGGDGTGGWASIFAANSDFGPSSISVQGVESAAFVSASGYGGAGGNGLPGIGGTSGGTGTSGGAGGDGGDGGTGTGGVAAITAAAGNGTLNISLGFVDATGTGGAGGNGGNGGAGGNGDPGAGGNGGAAGNGGAGGAAFGGLAVAGTQSGTAQAAGSNLGVANLGSVEFDVSAEGGAGGAGGVGGLAGTGTPDGVAGANGNGGAGGNAESGTAILQVEGGTANIGSANLVSIAAGGDGGSGAVQGVGGDAESDEARVLVTNRAGDTALRGTLNAGQITGSVFSTGGTGSIAGIGLMEGGSGFVVENGDATIDLVSFNIVADGLIPDLATDSIAIVNGAVVVNGSFSFNTSGVASVYADNGTLNAVTFGVSASNFIHDPERLSPAVIGTIGADSFSLVTGQDLIVDAHLISTGSLSLTAPGLIDVEDATSGGNLTLGAGSSISGGSMTATGLIDANAVGDIGLNLIIAGSDINMQSAAGSIFANGLSAGGLADLHANVDVSTGDITSGNSINILADTGGISVGDLLAQTSVDLNAPGAITISGIVDAGTNINMAGATIGAGDMTAGGFISLSADTILAGDLTASGFIDLFAGGPATIIVGDLSGAGVYATSIGDITTGTIDSSLDVDLLSFNGSISTLDVTAATNITADAAGLLTMGNLTGQTIDLTAGTGLAVGDVSATELLATTLAGDMSFGDITTLLGLSLNAQGSILTGFITTGDFVTLQAGGTIDTGAISATTDVTLLATGNVTTGDITAGGLIDATGASLTLGNLNANSIDLTTTVADLTVGDVTIPGNLALTTAGDLVFGNLSAFDVDLAATLSMTGGDINSTTDITALAGTTMSLGNLVAGLDVTLDATGNLVTGDITAGGLIDATGASLILGNLNANSIDLTTTVADLTVGNVIIPGSLALTTAGDLVFGDLNAFDVDLAATGAMSGGDIDSTTNITAVAGTSISVGALTAGGFDGEVFQLGDIILTAGSDFSTGLVSAAGAVSGDAGTSITMLDISALDAVDLQAGSSIATGNVDADSVNMVAGTDITTGDIFAFGAVSLDALGFLTTGDITAGTIDLMSGDDMATGDLTTQISGQLVALLFPGASITLESGGDIATGDIASRDGVYANAGGSLSTGTIDAVDFAELHAINDILTGNILAGDYISIFTDGGIATGDLTGTIIDLDALGEVTFGNVVADDFDFETDGDVTGGNITASRHVGGDTLGAVVLGDISVGPGLPPNDDFSVGIAGGTSVTVGDVSAAGRVGFATFGDLNTGDIVAGDLFITLVGGDSNVGAITTAAGGTVYLADASMYAIGTGGGEFDFNYALVVGLDPVPTGGSITIGGPVSTGLFQAAAGGDLTTQAITANQIDASAGGTATLNGLWQAPDVELRSNDIEIAAAGGIDAGNNGLIRLVSTNSTQALIGDGLTGTGYALTNTEFGQLSAGNVQILARGDASAAIDMLIGDLSITGPLAGSTIDDPLGSVAFATGDPLTEVAGGVIRVVGDVSATGFTADNALEFTTGRFELDAATGGINILGSGTDLGGELYIEADRIHVASGTILDQLAADPHYAGYQDNINAPAAVQRPEGVIRAGSIVVAPTEAMLVQNVGTEDQRAGFTANSVDLIAPEGAAPGSIELIVNGQLLGQAGTLFGVAVRDVIVPQLNVSLFTDNSMINGCLLTGACGVIEPPEPPFPPGFTPTPGIQDEVRLVEQNLLPPPEFDNDSFIDDNDATTEEGETSPIEPPQPLFDTSGLSDKGDVDDPVSGSGNPALMETVPPPSNQEKQP